MARRLTFPPTHQRARPRAIRPGFSQAAKGTAPAAIVIADSRYALQHLPCLADAPASMKSDGATSRALPGREPAAGRRVDRPVCGFPQRLPHRTPTSLPPADVRRSVRVLSRITEKHRDGLILHQGASFLLINLGSNECHYLGGAIECERLANA